MADNYLKMILWAALLLSEEAGQFGAPSQGGKQSLITLLAQSHKFFQLTVESALWVQT